MAFMGDGTGGKAKKMGGEKWLRLGDDGDRLGDLDEAADVGVTGVGDGVAGAFVLGVALGRLGGDPAAIDERLEVTGAKLWHGAVEALQRGAGRAAGDDVQGVESEI